MTEIPNEQIPVDLKYSVVFRFLSTPFELNIFDLAWSKDKITQEQFANFIDEDGRLWARIPKNDIIIIRNNPGKEDIEFFAQLKRENKEYEDKMIHNQKEPVSYMEVG